MMSFMKKNISQSIMYHYMTGHCFLQYKIQTRKNRNTWEEYLLSYWYIILAYTSWIRSTLIHIFKPLSKRLSNIYWTIIGLLLNHYQTSLEPLLNVY